MACEQVKIFNDDDYLYDLFQQNQSYQQKTNNTIQNNTVQWTIIIMGQ